MTAQLPLMPPEQPAWADRFWAKVDTSDPDGCWPWLATRTRGYGRFKLDGMRAAHRISYELAYGPIPNGLTIDHLCHNSTGCLLGARCPHRSCCRPDHLEAVSNRVNCLRGEGRAATNARKKQCEKHGTPLVNKWGFRRCLECQKEWKMAGNHRYREAHPLEVRERNSLWHAANREKELERKRRWREVNPEQVRETQRRWYAANREKELERQRRWRAAKKAS